MPRADITEQVSRKQHFRDAIFATIASFVVARGGNQAGGIREYLVIIVLAVQFDKSRRGF